MGITQHGVAEFVGARRAKPIARNEF